MATVFNIQGLFFQALIMMVKEELYVLLLTALSLLPVDSNYGQITI